MQSWWERRVIVHVRWFVVFPQMPARLQPSAIINLHLESYPDLCTEAASSQQRLAEVVSCLVPEWSGSWGEMVLCWNSHKVILTAFLTYLLSICHACMHDRSKTDPAKRVYQANISSRRPTPIITTSKRTDEYDMHMCMRKSHRRNLKSSKRTNRQPKYLNREALVQEY